MRWNIHIRQLRDVAHQELEDSPQYFFRSFYLSQPFVDVVRHVYTKHRVLVAKTLYLRRRPPCLFQLPHQVFQTAPSSSILLNTCVSLDLRCSLPQDPLGQPAWTRFHANLSLSAPIATHSAPPLSCTNTRFGRWIFKLCRTSVALLTSYNAFLSAKEQANR